MTIQRTVISGAAALLLSAPVFAQTNIEVLEQLQKDMTELKRQNERLQAEVEYLKEATKAQRKEVAEEEVAEANQNARIAAASKFSWKGDLRYRHENIDAEEGAMERTRHRLRARFGFSARINPTLAGVLQLATDGGSSDPRSPNQDLGNGWTRKPLAFDLAYAEWKPLPSLAVQVGKMPMPWARTGSFFFDGDITPEGAAVKYTQGSLFGTVFGYWLSERATGVDSKLMGGQVGWKQAVGGVTFTGALSYFDLVKVQNEITTAATGCTANPAFFGGPHNNSTYTSGGCARLLSDFNDLQVQAQADFLLGKLPVNVFADYMVNTAAEVNPAAGKKLDTAWAAGVTLGRAVEPQTWEVGYAYQYAEKDSVFAQFHDSDFNGNATDGKGHAYRAGYAPAQNWIIDGIYYVNQRFMDVGTPRDYDRLMLSLNYRF